MNKEVFLIRDGRQAKFVDRATYIKIMTRKTKGMEKARRERVLYLRKESKSYESYLKDEAKKEGKDGICKSWLRKKKLTGLYIFPNGGNRWGNFDLLFN